MIDLTSARVAMYSSPRHFQSMGLLQLFAGSLYVQALQNSLET
eukprot:CAMPEP_0175769084 /NCGR_PEP_ID=MMETSP0097-20121207/70773_1 /TAXON_ID=311494 /ORGANISM="Alexandrium monilatum, Strain CCMP3105" /LENGTH=42 /DNA_ID= /DNA_START= /DNA_END= /DNA_ORIENTATION=